MHHFQKSRWLDAPPEMVFDLSLDVDFHKQSMSESGEQITGGVGSGEMSLNQTVTWRARHFGIWWSMTSVISEYDRPNRFVDEQVKGPFRHFWHEHRFEAVNGGTEMTDIIDMQAPLGPAGALVQKLILNRYLESLIELRNAELEAELARRRK